MLAESDFIRCKSSQYMPLNPCITGGSELSKERQTVYVQFICMYWAHFMCKLFSVLTAFFMFPHRPRKCLIIEETSHATTVIEFLGVIVMGIS